MAAARGFSLRLENGPSVMPQQSVQPQELTEFAVYDGIVLAGFIVVIRCVRSRPQTDRYLRQSARCRACHPTGGPMTEQYIDPRPNSKIGCLRIALMYLLDGHRRDDALPTSVHALFADKYAIEGLGQQAVELMRDAQGQAMSPLGVALDLVRGAAS